MKITKKLVNALVADGIDSKSKVTEIVSAIHAASGNAEEQPTKAEIKEIREALESLEDDAELSPEEAESSAKKALKEMKDADNRYAHVTGVVEASPAGRPIRVAIKCQDPQVDGEGTSVCQKTREIAIQDAFQVNRCESCQSRKTQIYRNDLARKRRAAAQKATPKKKAAKKTAKAA